MSSPSSHLKVLRIAVLASTATFAFAFALVPLYRIACTRLFGIRLEAVAADDTATGDTAAARDLNRTITVEFDTRVNSKLDWDFRAAVPSVEVHPGVPTDALFIASNRSAQTIVGQAVPSIAPSAAARYFDKTECFCFTEQLLAAGEERAMPVRFMVDPRLPTKVQTLTLSYTFYNNEIATARVNAKSDAAAGAH